MSICVVCVLCGVVCGCVFVGVCMCVYVCLLLESIKVRCDVNIINKCTIGTVNIIYLICDKIHNKIQLYLYVLLQPLKRLFDSYFSNSAKFGRLVNHLNLRTV